MIQKITTGRGFRGVLNYVLREGGSKEKDAPVHIVDSNMRGQDARELASEFGALRTARPELNRAVHHCSLRLPDDEHLTPEQWGAVARDYLHGMGFDKSPYVVVDHDKDHNHIHIVASRIDIDGNVVSDSHERYRSQDVVYQIEEKYHLRHAYDRDKPREREHSSIPTLSRTEQEIATRTGETPPKMLIAERINEAIDLSDGTRESFTRELEGRGVDVHWNESPTTGRISGASYELRDYDGEMTSRVQGRQIGPDYSWTKLDERLRERTQEIEREAQQEQKEPERKEASARDHTREERDIAAAIKEPDSRGAPAKPPERKVEKPRERDHEQDWDR